MLMLTQVTQVQRNQAKKITYAVLYGMGPWGLAKELNMDVKA